MRGRAWRLISGHRISARSVGYHRIYLGSLQDYRILIRFVEKH
jgi:hypothetical protein